MSVLAPLYLLGGLAVALPILFHLIRRRPTGAVEFSSLMFLQPTSPRLTRRSRLENWPLLLLRALALLLLAAAFARPFLRQTESSSDETIGQRLVILLDTSASMQRPELWEAATTDATNVINQLSPKDQLAVVVFDNQPRIALSFEQCAELDADQRKTAALAAVRDSSPTWKATDMGRAISYAADIVSQYETDDAAKQSDDDNSTARVVGESSLVLISDMQQGSQIESLQQYSWPKKLSLEIHRVGVQQPSNAAVSLLPETHSDHDADRIRVRVSNAANSEKSRFSVAFAGGHPSNDNLELPVQVPPGESRVVRMPLPSKSVTSLVLRGDDQAFDNQRFLVSHEPEPLTLLFVGSSNDKGDDHRQESPARESLLYYLKRVPLSNSRGEVTVTPVAPEKLTVVPEPISTPLIVVADPISTDVADRLKQYVAQGGRVLFVLPQPSDSDSGDNELQTAIRTVANSDDDSMTITESKVKDYVMLSGIDFAHPVFKPMADPQFNDFTKVRFWSHRTIANIPADWSVLASFDDGDPALLESQNDKGRVWVLTAGWQPSSSQLALSTKFLPLVFSFFGRTVGQANEFATTVVGEAPPYSPTDSATITAPSGIAFDYSQSEDADQIDQPGVYTYQDEVEKTFAVNLASSESNTTPLDDEAFERFGVKLGKPLSPAQTDAAKRQLRDIELEKQQKVWQWLLMTALVLLAAETLWGGLISRGSSPGTTEKVSP
ncbi:BatA domain-containing protein [Planctomycetes bacterium K23_9]|uniref:VWFA domain-containing protein n=1 Tax=Stieleria marina TaxID=1930275 RepID=A0A517NYP3_9BACT|nr:hypothetical protein K239x_42450 [Planctomycetes bacterium K23_9]